MNNVKEIPIDLNKSALKSVTILASVPPSTQTEVANLSSVFQDKKNIVDPIKEREFLMKLNAMEDSDTELIGNVERPILGKVSLMRRAKSAVSRSVIERRINDKHPLFNVAWENHISMNKPDLVSKNESQTIVININDEDKCYDNDIPTPEEVKRHIELFHLRRGHPSPSATLEKRRKSKHSKKIRSARATKSNRVAPSDVIDEAQTVQKISTRIRSAKISTTMERNESDLSPDPLEPWSTKDLLDINKILES